MPLVRIDLHEGYTKEEINNLSDAIHEVLVKTFSTPDKDRLHIFTEHKIGYIVAHDLGLGYTRSEKVLFLQIVQQGRTREQKQEMYGAMCARLEVLGIQPADLLISVTENTKEDWSFGMGKAQFLTGEL